MTYFDDAGDFDDLLGFSAPTEAPKSKSRKKSTRNSPAAPLEGASDGRVEIFQGIPAELDEAALAPLLGITANRLRTLARDGIIIRSGRGKFDVAQSVTRYIAKLRESASRAGPPSVGGDELKAERTRLAKEQADSTALKNAQLRGELVSAEEAQRAWASILTDVRAGLLAIPSRLPELTSEQKAQLDLEIRLALERLSNG